MTSWAKGYAEGALTGCVVGMLVGFVMTANALHAADFPVRRHIPIPASRPEPCVSPEARPLAGQVMTADTTCASGLRWKFQR